MAANGLVRILGNAELAQQEQATRQAAQDRQAAPLIVGLAAHLHTLWEPARLAKKPIENRMLVSMRQRNGEYEADVLSAIQEQGGSQVYMMLTETKCRGAESWLRDILMDTGELPFDIAPPPLPDLNPETDQQVHEAFAKQVISTIQNTGTAPDPLMMEDLKEKAVQDVRQTIHELAEQKCNAMHIQIDEQFADGDLIGAFDEFLSDLTTYPNAWLKGPVVRRNRKLAWVQGEDGKYAPDVQEVLAPKYMRVDPYRIYPEPGLTRLEDGYIFEHHRLTRPELSELIGVPGYDDDAIREILSNMADSNLTNWLWSAEMSKAQLEQKFNTGMRKTEIADALEFWG